VNDSVERNRSTSNRPQAQFCLGALGYLLKKRPSALRNKLMVGLWRSVVLKNAGQYINNTTSRVLSVYNKPDWWIIVVGLDTP